VAKSCGCRIRDPWGDTPKELQPRLITWRPDRNKRPGEAVIARRGGKTLCPFQEMHDPNPSSRMLGGHDFPYADDWLTGDVRDSEIEETQEEDLFLDFGCGNRMKRKPRYE